MDDFFPPLNLEYGSDLRVLRPVWDLGKGGLIPSEKLAYHLLDPAKTIIVRFFNSSEQNYEPSATYESERTHNIWIDAVTEAKDNQRLAEIDLFQVRPTDLLF